MDTKAVTVLITENNKSIYHHEEKLGKDANSFSHIIPHVEIIKGKANDFLTLLVKKRETNLNEGEPRGQVDSQPRKKKSK